MTTPRARYCYRPGCPERGPKAERVKVPSGVDRYTLGRKAVRLMRERGLLRDGPLGVGMVVTHGLPMSDAGWACIVEAVRQIEAQA